MITVFSYLFEILATDNSQTNGHRYSNLGYSHIPMNSDSECLTYTVQELMQIRYNNMA